MRTTNMKKPHVCALQIETYFFENLAIHYLIKLEIRVVTRFNND